MTGLFFGYNPEAGAVVSCNKKWAISGGKKGNVKTENKGVRGHSNGFRWRWRD